MSQFKQYDRLVLSYLGYLDIVWAAELDQEELLVLLAVSSLNSLTLETLSEKVASNPYDVSLTLSSLVNRGILIKQEERPYEINWEKLESLPRKLPQSVGGES